MMPFMGDPYTDNGFGCYAPCIVKAVQGFLPENCVLKNTTGMPVPELLRKNISMWVFLLLCGLPCIWKSLRRGPSGFFGKAANLFQWIRGEHCLVFRGYNSEYYYFNDPLSGKVRYERELVETRYSQMEVNLS